MRRWVPSRNQQRVGDCCHKIISFSKNRLKCKNVCSFQYCPKLIYRLKFNEVEVTEGNWWRVTIEREKKKKDNIASYLGVFLVYWTKKIAMRKCSICSILKMQLDTASLKPQIYVVCKCDLAKTASPNDCIYCILYQTMRFCPENAYPNGLLILLLCQYQQQRACLQQ